MTQASSQIGTRIVDGHVLRTVTVGGMEYVATSDFTAMVQGLVHKITELTRRQQEQLATMSLSVGVLYEVLSAKHPELEQELLQLFRQAGQPV